MTVKSISYDLGAPETSGSYKDLIEAIKALGSWAKPLESFWLVDTSLSSAEIRDQLLPYLDLNDRLLVNDFSPHSWASWRLPPDVVDWLKRH